MRTVRPPAPYFGGLPRGVEPTGGQGPELDEEQRVGAIGLRRRERGLLHFPVLFLLLGLMELLLTPAAGAVKPDAGQTIVRAALLVLSLYATHILLRRLVPHADKWLLPIMMMMTALGLLFLWRLEPTGSVYAGIGLKQTIWVISGLALLLGVTALLRDLTRLMRLRYLFAVAGLLLVLLPVFNRDSPQSFNLGQIGFQPSELLKIILAIYIAAYIAKRRDLLAPTGRQRGSRRSFTFVYLLPMLVLLLLALALLLLEDDLGAALLFFGVFLVMLYVGGAKPLHIAGGVVALLLAVPLLAMLLPGALARVVDRYNIWLNPWPLEPDLRLQMVNSLFSLSSGGVLGTGFGFGQPERVPAVHTDMIIVAIGEEFGLAGTLAVLCLVGLLIYTGLRIALSARSGFEQLLATGLTAVLGLQSLIILAGSTKLIPLTGITLPFISYGGSSFWVNSVIVALLLRVSDAARSKATQRSGEATAQR